MLEHLDALVSLAKNGTMQKAAIDMRVTQSAISKRIALLEHRVGVALIEPDGRRVRLTAAGMQLVARSEGLLVELKSVLDGVDGEASGTVRVGVSESILSSWGPGLLHSLQSSLPSIMIEVHAHRSPVIIERIMSGEYHLGIISGLCEVSQGLWMHSLPPEPFVVINKTKKRVALSTLVEDILTIEPRSATWRSIGRDAKRAFRGWGMELGVTHSLESFSCITQMAKQGLYNGLVPRSLATALAVPSAQIVKLPKPGISRPISVICRQNSRSRAQVNQLIEHLIERLESIKAYEDLM